MLPHGIGVKRFEDILRSLHLKLCTEPIAVRRDGRLADRVLNSKP